MLIYARLSLSRSMLVVCIHLLFFSGQKAEYTCVECLWHIFRYIWLPFEFKFELNQLARFIYNNFQRGFCLFCIFFFVLSLLYLVAFGTHWRLLCWAYKKHTNVENRFVCFFSNQFSSNYLHILDNVFNPIVIGGIYLAPGFWHLNIYRRRRRTLFVT